MESKKHWKNLHIASRISEVASFIKSKLGAPDLALVLGSGLKGIKDELVDPHDLHYDEIPNMPRATVMGHGSKLIMGKIGDKKVLCWSGRVHGYQGYSPIEVSFIAYVSAFIGARAIVITNASGGNDEHFHVGSIMMIKDYISWASGCPQYSTLKDVVLGPRNMHGEPIFSSYLQEVSKQVAKDLKIDLKEGNYCFTSGPTFESPHDIKVLRKLGAQAVGMSTVPEIFGARQLKLNVLAFSLITNLASGLSKEQLSHQEVFQAASEAGPVMQKFIRTIIEKTDLTHLSAPETPERTMMISLDQFQLNSQNFPQDFAAKRLNRQSIIEASHFIKAKLELKAPKKLVVICAPLQETCQEVEILKSLPMNQIPHFPKFSKSAFTSKIISIVPQNVLLLLCPRQELFHETESYAIVEMFKEIGIQHYTIVMPAHPLIPSDEIPELEEICDYSDRNYCTALTRTRVSLTNLEHGKTLVSYQGPVYPTFTEKKIFSEAFKFDYCSISNLSLVTQIDKVYKLSRSLLVVPRNFDTPGFDFSELKLSASIIQKALTTSKSNYSLEKIPAITKSFKFAGHFEVLVPDFAELGKIKEAARVLKIYLEAQSYKSSVLIVKSEFVAALIHNVTIINSINFVYESGVKAHLLVAQVNKVEFLVLVNDCEDRAGELSLDTVTTPIRVLKLAGINNFIFLNILVTPIKELRVKISLYKDRMMWNMKNALIGKNVEEWGPRFPDISKQTDSILYTTFKEIWKEKTGEELNELVAMWENNSKPYYGPSDINAMNVLECQGFLKGPVNEIITVVHMGGKALCILFPLKNEQECRVNSAPIEKLFTEALPELFQKCE